jgi:ketosteroid isomerase-like protein
MSSTHPLTTREAITDTLHGCLLGLDTNSRALFASACVTDASMLVTAGTLTLSGWPVIEAYFQRVFELVTSHMTSNIRIQIHEGGETATLTAHAMAYHVRPEDAFKEADTSYTAANLYDIEVVRVAGEGVWRIKKWDIKVLWTTGDRGVLHG